MQLSEQLVLILDEALPRMKIGIEAADKRFVVGTESGNNGGEAGLDLAGLLSSEVVVQQDHRGDRESLGGEKFDALLDIVVEDAELVASEVGDQSARPIF